MGKKILGVLLALITIISINTTSISAKERLVANNYDVVVDILEDGRFLVTETIDMQFNQRLHGIFVDIRQEYQLNIDGETQYHYFPVTDIKVYNNEPYEIEEELEYVRIILGSEDSYAPEHKEYKVSYIVNTKPFEADVLGDKNITSAIYFNIIGAHHEYPIQNSTFTLNFPKPVDASTIFVEAGRDMIISGGTKGDMITTLTGSYNKTLSQEGISILMSIPDDYFTFRSSINVWIGVAISGLIAVLLIVYVSLKGKGKVIIDSVEFTAPNGFNSADVGYIFRNYSKPQDMTSLIIYWASKGYLTIEEFGKKNDLRLTKVANISEDTSAAERLVFYSIFSRDIDGDSVTMGELKKRYIGGKIQQAVSMEGPYFSKNPERRLFEKKDIGMKVLACFIIPLILVPVTAILAHNIFMVKPGSIFIFGYLLPYVISAIAVMFMMISSRYIKNKGLKLFISILMGGLISVFLFLYSLYTSFTLVIFLIILLLLSFTIYLYSAVSIRTENGARWYGQVLGLRNFIQVADKERLEMLVNENPEYFYDILPYAYVLGVTDVWSKKFESINITPPTWYYSNNMNTFTTWYLWSSLNRNMNTMNKSMMSVPPSKSGGKFGGGGFSGGGGGGGFSGGGFGGSGGGGW